MSDHNEPVPGETARPKLNIGFMALEPRFAEEVNFLSPDRGFDLAHRDLVILSSRRCRIRIRDAVAAWGLAASSWPP